MTRRASPASAHERLVRLCELFLLFSRSRHGITLAEVMAAAGISRSTFFRDLKVLQDAGVPLEQHEGRYRFLNAPAVPALGLSAEQVASLQLARLQLAPLGGSVLLKELDRLLNSLGRGQRAPGEQTSFRFAEPRRALPAPRVVRAVEKALSSRRRLLIEYRAATRGGALSRLHIEPLVVNVAEADPPCNGCCFLKEGTRSISAERERLAVTAIPGQQFHILNAAGSLRRVRAAALLKRRIQTQQRPSSGRTPSRSRGGPIEAEIPAPTHVLALGVHSVAFARRPH